MNEEMVKAYEGFKQEFLGVAAQQKQINAAMPVDGERITVQLDGREIEVIYYHADHKNAPVIFTAFGGGFVMGGCAMDNLMWKSLSEELDSNIISIGYRKAPEYLFPAAVNDVYDTICHFMQHVQDYGFDSSRVSVLGSSAGGNLAAAATILDNKNETHYIKNQILFYPYLDLETAPEQKGHGMDELFMYLLFPETYLQSKEDRKNILVSPVFAKIEDLRGMPNTMIFCGMNDPLRHEGEKYAEHLKEAGVHVYYQQLAGMRHGFIEFAYSLQTMPLGQPFCPEEIKKDFLDGKLKEQTDVVLLAVKKHLVYQ